MRAVYAMVLALEITNDYLGPVNCDGRELMEVYRRPLENFIESPVTPRCFLVDPKRS